MIGFLYDYGDELTVEESSERLKEMVKGFATEIVFYGASKIFTPPALPAKSGKKKANQQFVINRLKEIYG